MRNAIMILTLFSFIACNTNSNKLVEPDFSAGPPAIVYKTTQNFDALVPVQLSTDQASIIAFPHPTDLKKAEQLTYPTQLESGYLLDNRGIDVNTKFLDMTYEDYAALKEPPKADSLLYYLIDQAPFLEIYNCGNRHHFQDIELEINQLFLHKELKKRCKKLL
jgi:hypothetical protein